MANINLDRQKDLNLTIPNSVAVVGCGGVGSWVAYLLALAGVPNLYLFDHDTVEDHNLNRLPFTKEQIGKLKSIATVELIHTVRETNCLALTRFNSNLAQQLSLHHEVFWIVAATDTLDSRLEVYNWAKRYGIAYMEAAAEGEIGSATGKPAEWRTPEDAQPGYASVPVWVGPCVSSALIAVTHILHNKNMKDSVIRIGWEENSFLTFNSLLTNIKE